MKILFLGYKECKLLTFLKNRYNVIQTEEKININDTLDIDYIISFGYKHIITKNIIEKFKNKIINLHISYLPYNKGYHPNFWSFYENTPKGVTIHLIDEGIDTGDILIQQLITFNETENTYEKTYNTLIECIQDLFINNCDNILNQSIIPFKQPAGGSFHYKKDLDAVNYLLTEGWNTSIYGITTN